MKDNTKITLLTYLRHSWKYKISFITLCVGIIVASVADTVTPWFFKEFFDTLVSDQEAHVVAASLIMILLVVAVLRVIGWVAWRVLHYTNVYFQPHVMADLANTCFEYLHKHSYSFFTNTFVGAMVKKVNRFSRSFEQIADRIIFNLIPLIISISIIIIILFTRSILLSLVILVWVAVFLILNWLFIRYKIKYDIQSAEAESEVTGVLADTITNHSNVKLFNGYKRELKFFADVNEKLRKIRNFSWTLEMKFEIVQTGLMLLLEIGSLYIGIRLWQKGVFTIGDFVLLQSYVLIVFMKVWDFGRVVRHFYRELAEAEEMTEILQTPHEIIDSRVAKKISVKKGKIEFIDVDFSYRKTRTIFSDLNMVIEPGEKVALVGPSGAGKTTVVKLLLRIHDIDGGKILIDGQKIKKVTLESLWQNTSLVSQDPILFHRTLKDNIKYGKPKATNKDILSASRRARCHEFIKDFPDGYDTYVGERGVKLSGGERQRVAIARAILKNAPILVLDEATSSLDSESERLIQEALANLMKDKTVIVIAHRLSTIKQMDRIIVIDQGRIVEQGTHDQLANMKGGHYKKLWELQAGGFIQ